MEYIQDAAADETDGCIFCDIPSSVHEADRILARGDLAYVVLNKFPYNPGHVLIVPYRHTPDIEDLMPEESAELQSLLGRSVRALREEADPHGFNIGMNLGRVAGAGRLSRWKDWLVVWVMPPVPLRSYYESGAAEFGTNSEWGQLSYRSTK